MRKRWRIWGPELLAAGVAAILAANLAVVVGIGLSLLRQWHYTGAAWIALPWAFFGPHEAAAWQSAILGAGVGAWALSRPWSRTITARALAAIVALGLAALALFGLWPTEPAPGVTPDPWAGIGLALGLGAGAAAAGWLARRDLSIPLASPRLPHRIVLAVALATAALWPSIAESIDAHRDQTFAEFRLDFVAAFPAAEDTPGAVFIDGQWWTLSADDHLTLEDDDVRRVRWAPEPGTDRPGVVIDFDAPTAAAVRDRSLGRYDQFDAIVVDGRRFMVVSYQGELLTGELALFVPPARRDDLGWLYQRLTTMTPPVADER